MKLFVASGAITGLIVAGQNASQYLDEEMAASMPALDAVVQSIDGAVHSGLSLGHVALATVALPVFYQLVRILSGYAELHRDGIREMRERQTAEHRAALELRTERERAAIAREGRERADA